MPKRLASAKIRKPFEKLRKELHPSKLKNVHLQQSRLKRSELLKSCRHPSPTSTDQPKNNLLEELPSPGRDNACEIPERTTETEHKEQHSDSPSTAEDTAVLQELNDAYMMGSGGNEEQGERCRTIVNPIAENGDQICASSKTCQEDDYVESSEAEHSTSESEDTNRNLEEKDEMSEPAIGEIQSFAELGLAPELVHLCSQMKWSAPTPIQKAAIPPALEGRDIIGLAVTGSGKTAAFVLPIIHRMLTHSVHPIYAVVVSPTRELCAQISEQFNAFGVGLMLKIVTLVGGLSNVEQAKSLARNPHVIVASPGRLVDHLENTKGFSVTSLEFLVLDEADRLLTLDFEEELKKIIRQCPAKRQTFLFSATMTSRVSKLQKLSLQKPVKVSVDEKTQTATNLTQYMVLVPLNDKFAFMTALLRKFEAYRSIVFCNTCKIAVVLAAFLRRLNISLVALTGDMKQAIRLGALSRFRRKECKVLITTEVGARGLDLPEVHYVINFDVPMNYRDYIHRVGRTARAGQSGQSFTLVTQYEAERFLSIESKIGVRCEKWDEIQYNDYKQYESASLRKAAEQEYEEAKRKKIFRKK